MKEQSRLSRSGGWVGILKKSLEVKKKKREKEKKETKGRALKVTI